MNHSVHIEGTYNLLLVSLSYVIAVMASYAAIDLAGKISISRGAQRRVWLTCGALAMGLGIWSMHFVGMLALAVPFQVSYDSGLVVLSVLLAVFVSGVALSAVNRRQFGYGTLLLSGLLMAAGICGMHYVGMAAMLADISYDAWLVALSVLIAASASVAALGLLFYFRRHESRMAVLYKLGSALIMGAAIAGMHYTGMLAAHFHGSRAAGSAMSIKPDVLAYIIGIATFFLLTLTLLGLFVNKRLSQKDNVILENEGWYRSLYMNNADGIISVDRHDRIVRVNPSALHITGLRAEQLLGLEIGKLDMGLLRQGTAEELPPGYYEASLRHPDGKAVEISVLDVPVDIGDNRVGKHLMIRDITMEKQTRQKVRHLAYHDELTGLPNRRLFNQLLEENIRDHAEAGDGASFAVMVMDIDRFKMINDSLGHTVGDFFLQTVSGRILLAAKGCRATIARMGGDEFTILCPTGPDGAEAEALAYKLIEALRLPFRLKESDFYISASIGTSLYPQHGNTPVELLKKADAAMYEVKKRGKNAHQFYSPDLDNQLLWKIELEGELRQAIRRNQLTLYYQPQIRTEDQRMIGVEALIRWNHPTRGMLPPGLFVPIAEETGLILEIGSWVLREACRQMRLWHQAGGPLIPVSVNLSSQQFHQSGLVEHIVGILKETGLPPEYLELEITESMMMDASVSRSLLEELNRIGVRISLDDFGTGYSSLHYLKTFPIDKLKIDRSFIKDISTNDNDKAIVATIISMAHHLHMDVIAEGIETKDQLDILTASECRKIQGYYFSRPLSADDVEQSFFVPQR